MEFILFRYKLTNTLAIKSSSVIEDRSTVIRYFSSECYKDAIMSCKEIRDEISKNCSIPVLIVDYLEEPIFTVISNSLREYQKIVGGPIQVVSCPDLNGIDIVCNDEGKVLQLPLNRALTNDREMYDIVAGPMILVGSNDDGDFVGLNYEAIARAYQHFRMPELFVVNDVCTDIEVLNCSDEIARIMKLNKIPNVSLK